MIASHLRCLWFSFAALQASALLFGQTPMPDRASFFTEPDYKGDCFIVEAGAAVPDLARFVTRDQRTWLGAISSVRVEGAARVTVYDMTEFQGRSVELTTSVSNLAALSRGNDTSATWGNCIQSLAVARPQPTAPSTTVIVAPPPQPQVVQIVNQPPAPPPPPQPTYTPREAEEIIEHAYRDVLGRRADPEGRHYYREKLMRDGWTENRLYDELRRSAEARAINPDTVITKAYRELLGRDPDPAGLDHYRRLWRDGWIQGRIREDLARSDEARDYSIKTFLTHAYRELLGREPDADGFASYRRLMRDKGWDEARVRQSIMQSDEYRNRQRHPPADSDSHRRDRPH